MVKNLPAMQEMRVQSLGGEDPLEKGMATHTSVLAWRIPWTEKAGGFHGVTESDKTERLNTHTHTGPIRSCNTKGQASFIQSEL